jgi:hypothetical protein
MNMLGAPKYTVNRDPPRKLDLIEWMKLGSLGSMVPLVRPFNRHNHHSKAILGVPE